MEPQKVTYYNEISLMMFGFGDSHKPNPETVRLVESIVLNQLKSIVKEALKYSDNDDMNLKCEELIFLMRKNKWKMRRFVKYLQNKELKKKIDNLNSTFKDNQSEKSPYSKLLEFIHKIDETGELTDMSEFDEEKYERQLRADRISEALDEKRYMEFYKARCTSFNSREFSQAHNFERLRMWIDPNKKITFNNYTLEILCYYAYETVAQITDYALLVRKDMHSTTDPFKSLSGAHYTAAMFNGEHRFTETKPDYSRVYTGQPPISVNEIKEVMRRVNSPQVGKLNFGRKLPTNQFLFAL